MLMWKEDQDTEDVLANSRFDAVKMALVAANQTTIDKQFPEYVQAKEDEGEYLSDIPVDEAKRIEELLESGGLLRFDDIETR